MMTYRLDKEAALILASAVALQSPGPASPAAGAGSPTARAVFTIEHMTKLSKDEMATLSQSLMREWTAILTSSTGAVASPARRSASKEEYWSVERTPKVRRLASEPQSPKPPALALAQPGSDSGA